MTFTPSQTFNARWLGSPTAMRQAILSELNDIKHLLSPSTSLDGFEFSTPNLHETLTHLQTAHLETLSALAKQRKQERADALIPVLEKQLDDRLTQSIDDLSINLKHWIRTAIQEELNRDTNTNL